MRVRWWMMALALMQAASADAAWQKASSSHFVVYSDDTPAKVRDFSVKLERFDKALRVLTGAADDVPSPLSRVTVFMVRDIDAVERLFGKGGSNVAGFFIPRASGSVAFVPRKGAEELSALPILLHEYTHHFMWSAWGHAVFPTWLIEGYAEFMAPATFRDDGSVVLGNPPLYRAYEVFDRTSVPIEKLLIGTPKTDLPVFYGRSWALTHYMMLNDDRRHKLDGYIAAINGGTSPAKAMPLLGDMRRLDTYLSAYARQQRLPVFVLAASALPVGDVSVQPLSAAEAAMMPAVMSSRRGVDPAQAPQVAALARRLAAPYPDDAFAQNELAEAEYDAGQWAAAEAAAGRAIAADPKSVHAMIYAGRAREGEAKAAGVTDPATWKAIRRWFTRANVLDPDYPEPAIQFYLSFDAAGLPATANAQDGLIYAQTLAPFDGNLRLTAADVQARRGDADAALRLLRPVAYDPHGGDRAALAAEVIAAIDKGGAAAGLAKAKAAPAKASAAK